MTTSVKIQYCGAGTAQVPAIVIALLDTIFASLVLGLLGYIAHMHYNMPQEFQATVQRIDPQRTGNLANFLQYNRLEQALMLLIPIVSNAVGVLMGILLLFSSLIKAGKALRIWFVLTMILMIVQISIFTVQVVGGRQTPSFIIPPIVEYVYRLYSLLIVHAFIKEINSGEEG